MTREARAGAEVVCRVLGDADEALRRIAEYPGVVGPPF